MNDRQCLDTAVRLRRQIHEHPELGHQEFKTTELVARTLASAGYRPRRLKPTGVAAELTGKGKPCVALRADMDALPLTETTAWPHRSRRPGVMHACGHDAHTAMLLTAALALKSEGAVLPGTVKFFFQPDEEGAGGARQLIAQGLMETPAVNAVYGLHVNPRLPAGTLGVKPGPLMAGVDRFTLDVIGEGGHGAYPHEGRDAIVIAAHVITALQTIASRRVDPVEPVVLTVGTIQGGERFNILPGAVRLTGTVRTLSPELQARMPRMVNEIADGTARAHGGRCRLNYEHLGRPVINHAAAASLAREVAVSVVGEKRVIDLDRPSMGGEDFSEYLSRAPGCFVYLGTGANAKTRRPWHHPAFFLHEPSMAVGVRFLRAVARRALEQASAA
jgi:amidohydrolase